MDEFIVVKIMNEASIKLAKKQNRDFSMNENLKKYFEDEAFFFKITKELALKTLLCVGIKEDQVERVYEKLISPKTYDKLIKENKINVNDKSIIIKYDNN